MHNLFNKTRRSIFLSNYIRILSYCLFFVFYTNVSYTQWIQQNSGTTEHLEDIYMHDANTGWICGQMGTILKTNSGGTNWLSINTGVTLNISSIKFINSLTGWFTTRITGKIYKSTNGGLNWSQQFQTSATIQAISFADSLYGWAASFNGKVFRTSNGGLNWDSTSVNSGLNDVVFLNRYTGWACGIARDIFKTTNSGLNWIQQLGGQGGEIESLSFIDLNTGWAINLELYDIYKTINGGDNWNLIYTLPGCVNAHDIFFTNQNSGWASGDCGMLFSTTNGGVNWFQQLIGTSTFRQQLFFVNDTTGWSVGGGGVIIKTTNGGAVVHLTNLNSLLPDSYKLEQNYPNPFNPGTYINFTIPKNDYVRIFVNDITGKLVRLINLGICKAGNYNVHFIGDNLSSGIYFYTISTNNFKATKKMLLLK